MDDRSSGKSHRLSISDRKSGSLTGIKEVISFAPELVVLLTEQGNLTIKGRELHVIRLDVDKGELEMSGRMDSLVYTEAKSPGQMTSGLLKRMFK